jgi:hypothetical protein
MVTTPRWLQVLPKSFIMDEVGKYPFSAAFKAAEPAFKGANGWRAVPILVNGGHLIKVKMLRISFIIQSKITF